MLVLQLLSLLFLPVAAIVIGEYLLSFLIRDNTYHSKSISLLVGIAISLTVILFFRCAGLGWWVTVLPFLVLLDYLKVSTIIKEWLQPRLTLNLAAWLVVTALLGLALFQTKNGLETGYVNNYGDLPFHLGTIANFTFGDNFPPEYHIFAGNQLSYPFLINLWSAVHWWINPSWESLTFIFFFQWMLLWFVFFNIAGGGVLPWLVLLGGGSYLHLGQPSGELIHKNIVWSSFLTTIWGPQRTAMFGAPFLLAAATAISKGNIKLAGLMLAVMPLVHTHMFLVGVIFCLAYLLVINFKEQLGLPAVNFNNTLKNIVIFVAHLLPAVIFLPFILSKSGVVSFNVGWMVDNTKPFAIQLSRFFELWFAQGIVLPGLFIVLLFSRAFLPGGVAIIALFVVANLLQFAPWEWDQLKMFVAVYILLAYLATQTALTWNRILQFGLLLIIALPTLFEVGKIIKDNAVPSYKPYSQRDIQVAAKIRELTPPDAVIAANPVHNSSVVIAGRKLFYGYPGTLWTHGIESEARGKINQDFASLAKCKVRSKSAICPQYLYYEGVYFAGGRPELYGFKAVDISIGLYRLGP